MTEMLKTPTQPGWFWVCVPPGIPWMCTQVYEHDGELLFRAVPFSLRTVELSERARWVGPLEPPETP